MTQDQPFFYATIPSNLLREYMPGDVAYLLPASSWAAPMARQQQKWRQAGIAPETWPRKALPPVKLPGHVRHVAADCGGFVATFKWGEYAYYAFQYVNWCETIGSVLRWAAMMDLCMEPEITEGDSGLIHQRQNETTRMAELFWENYRDVPWAWVPTIQGWTTEDYVRHARQMAPLIQQMQHHYYERMDDIWQMVDGGRMTQQEAARIERNLMDFRVGIGTLCRRASAQQIREVVAAVRAELPGVKLHLWGVKLGAFRQDIPEEVVSVDSAAWNGRFGRDLEIQKSSGLSQAVYGYTVALPNYLDKVGVASKRMVRLPRRFQRVQRRGFTATSAP